MKATIVIVTKNRPKLLIERSLPSALNQTYPRTIEGGLMTGIHQYEIIVIDNSTNDETYQELIKGGKGFIYYKLPQPNNLAMARNKGVDLAGGKYVVSLDDDNEFYPDFLEETIKFLDDNFEYQAVGVGKNIIYPEGKVYQPPPQGDYFSMNDGFLIRKEAYQQIKCDETLTANDDADLGLRFLKRFKVGRIDKPLMTVYGSAIFNKTSYSDYSDYHLEGLIKFWLKNKDEFDEENGDYYKRMLGRYFLIASGRMKWFRFGYWLEQKLKRYYQILKSR